MTPKEKAVELVNKYLQVYNGRVPQAKQCALIAVDELIKHTISVNTLPYNLQSIDEDVQEYWQEVKPEIEKL